MPPLSHLVPPELSRAIDQGLLAVPEPAAGGLRTSIAQSTWRIPILMVSFTDSANHHEPEEFEQLLFDSTGAVPTGSAYEYYRWVSGGRLLLTGDVVAHVALPHPRSYYANYAYGLSGMETPNNDYGLVWDALRASAANVNWSDYDLDHDGYVDMLWVVHAGIGAEAAVDRNNFWSITSRLSTGWRTGTYYTTTDQVPGSANQRIRIDRFTMLPELSAFKPEAISEIGVYCHEFGHAMGLPDLYTRGYLTNQIDLGPGCWSLMSSGGWGSDGRSPQYPAHMGSWAMQFLGWDKTLLLDRDSTISLPPLEEGGPIIELSYQGEKRSEHYLIENRQRLGFDRNLVGEGLIIYHVDDATIGMRLRQNSINAGFPPGMRLLEGDNDDDLMTSANPCDPNDPYPGALGITHLDDDTHPGLRTFEGGLDNVSLSNIALDGRNVRVHVQVEPIGWLPARDFTGPSFDPIESFGLAREMGVDDLGISHWVTSEIRDNHAQIVLRSGHAEWGEPFVISASTRTAMDPALAVLPGGDLAVVWTDDRSGRSQIYYRSRLRGTWTPERLLFSLPGECHTPALGVDRHGVLSMAFQYVNGGDPQIRFMQFTYFAPSGKTVAVTPAGQRPGSPVVAVAPDGLAYILWSDRSSGPQRLRFARFSPDSGVVGSYALTPLPLDSQIGLSAMMDSRGTLNLVWQTSGPGVSQIHFQRRPRISSPDPVDTVLDSQGYLLQNPEVGVDPAGAVHIVFESAPSTVREIRYLRFQPTRGWDAYSTRITTSNEGSASRPQPLLTSDLDLSVAYIQYDGDKPHIKLRQRLESTLAGVAPPPPPSSSSLRLGPNPIRPGQSLDLWWAGSISPGRPRVEFFDVGGRRIGETNLERIGDRWRGHVAASSTRAWGDGILFARIPASRSEAVRLVVIR